MARKQAKGEPGLSHLEWASLSEAFERALFARGSRDLAAYDLREDMRSGCLPSRRRRVWRDGRDEIERLEPSFWGKWTLYYNDDNSVAVRSQDDGSADADPWRAPRWTYFADRRRLDERYPIETRRGADRLERERPGPKPTRDWPRVVAKWLIRIAANDPGQLKNVAELVKGARDHLQEEIGWAPKEDKELRRAIADFLGR